MDTLKSDGERKPRASRKTYYKKVRTSKYLEAAESELPKGPWADLETIVLLVLGNVLRRTDLPLTTDNYYGFYDLIFNYLLDNDLLNEYPIRPKSRKEIDGKIHHISLHCL